MRIIGYSSIDKVIITGPELKEIDLSGDIALVLEKRGCAGRWEGDTYVPCDSEESPYCRHCGSLPDPCITCRGECLKETKTCDVEHSVYLAIFSPDIVKVGVSKARRLETRLREQGADMGFEIARYPDGELARKRERSLAATFPDRISLQEKLSGMATKVDAGTLREIYGRYDASRIMRFDYFKEPLWMKPIVIEPAEGMAISGRVLGVKGKALIIEKRNTIYAINLDDLIGYGVEAGKGSVNLQTSLFEFVG